MCDICVVYVCVCMCGVYMHVSLCVVCVCMCGVWYVVCVCYVCGVCTHMYRHACVCEGQRRMSDILLHHFLLTLLDESGSEPGADRKLERLQWSSVPQFLVWVIGIHATKLRILDGCW